MRPMTWVVACAVLTACASASDGAAPVAPQRTVDAPTMPTPGAPAPSTSPPRAIDPATTARGTIDETTVVATTAAGSATGGTSPADCVAALPLAWRAGQVLMPAVHGDRLDEARGTVVAAGVGSVILMTWPAGADPGELATLRSATDVPLLVATDEEGGDVQRLRALGVLPAARDVAASMTPADAETMVAAHASAVAALGIDIVFAPVADVSPLTGPDPIGARAFSDDPDVVTEFVTAYVRGWRAAGVLPVLKHFPGHGRAGADTHESRATTPTIDELREHDLAPYAAVLGDPALGGVEGAGIGVMVGHLDVPGLTEPGTVASTSPAAVTGELRGRMGATGSLVFTDDIGMGAVAGSPGATAVASLAAGVDVIVHSSLSWTMELRDAIVAAVDEGRLDASRLDEAVGRVLAEKAIDPCELRLDRG